MNKKFFDINRRKKRNMREALERLMEGAGSKEDFRFFFDNFLAQCYVTTPRIAKDHDEIIWNESRRHLGMSYLSLLAGDTTETLVEKMRAQKEQQKDQLQELENEIPEHDFI